MNTNEINKQLHALLGLEWHEYKAGRGYWKHKCSCGNRSPLKHSIMVHCGKHNHTFASNDQKESDSGRVELLRIMKEKLSSYKYRLFFVKLNRILSPSYFSDAIEYFMNTYLTEQTGKHKLCCAVIEFLKERKRE